MHYAVLWPYLRYGVIHGVVTEAPRQPESLQVDGDWGDFLGKSLGASLQDP